LTVPLLNSPPPGAIQIPGGDSAPGRARRYVLERLDGRIDAPTTSDVALIVSELVTNSVTHANAGPDRAVGVELTGLDDRVRITVTDRGARSKPRLLPVDPANAHGFGLRLVEDLCCDWGVLRDGDGMTRVWCELRLDPAPRT
jgi:serine/threonine-protein kinase RsbW